MANNEKQNNGAAYQRQTSLVGAVVAGIKDTFSNIGNNMKNRKYVQSKSEDYNAQENSGLSPLAYQGEMGLFNPIKDALKAYSKRPLLVKAGLPIVVGAGLFTAACMGYFKNETNVFVNPSEYKQNLDSHEIKKLGSMKHNTIDKDAVSANNAKEGVKVSAYRFFKDNGLPAGALFRRDAYNALVKTRDSSKKNNTAENNALVAKVQELQQKYGCEGNDCNRLVSYVKNKVDKYRSKDTQTDYQPVVVNINVNQEITTGKTRKKNTLKTTGYQDDRLADKDLLLGKNDLNKSKSSKKKAMNQRKKTVSGLEVLATSQRTMDRSKIDCGADVTGICYSADLDEIAVDDNLIYNTFTTAEYKAFRKGRGYKLNSREKGVYSLIDKIEKEFASLGISGYETNILMKEGSLSMDDKYRRITSAAEENEDGSFNGISITKVTRSQLSKPGIAEKVKTIIDGVKTDGYAIVVVKDGRYQTPIEISNPDESNTVVLGTATPKQAAQRDKGDEGSNNNNNNDDDPDPEPEPEPEPEPDPEPDPDEPDEPDENNSSGIDGDQETTDGLEGGQ